MSKILIVDDEPKILRIIDHFLSREGYEISTAIDGQQALEQIHRHEYDLVVLDLALPKVDGFQVCRTIRETSSIPIIILSVRNQEVDKVLGFNLGVDDYLTKPFSPIELCLRIKAVLRRTKEERILPKKDIPIYYCNGLSIDTSTREVSIDEQLIELTAKEFDILWFMAKNPKKVFTRHQLLYQIWQEDHIGNEDTITVLISRLRDKIKRENSAYSFIQTLRGVGYRFIIS